MNNRHENSKESSREDERIAQLTQGTKDLLDERRWEALREAAVKATEEKVDRHCTHDMMHKPRPPYKHAICTYRSRVSLTMSKNGLLVESKASMKNSAHRLWSSTNQLFWTMWMRPRGMELVNCESTCNKGIRKH